MIRCEESKLLRIGLFAWVAVTAFFLIFFKLDSMPLFSYDEGFFAQIAMNVADHGHYASKFKADWVPVEFSVGPTFLLPMAAVFKLVGKGIFQARLWPAFCAYLFVLTTFLIVRRFSGSIAATACSVLLSGIHFFLFRYAIGENTALLSFLIGIIFLLRGLEDLDRRSYFVAGLCFGCMLAAKGSFIIVLPGIVLGVLIDRLFWKRVRLSYILFTAVGICFPLLVWFLLGVTSSGLKDFLNYTISWAQLGTQITIFVPGGSSVFHDSHLLALFSALIVLVAVTFSFTIRDKSLSAAQKLWLIFLLSMWACEGVWYFFLSLGLTRYMMVFVSLSLLIVGICLKSTIFRCSELLDFKSRGWLMPPTIFYLCLLLNLYRVIKSSDENRDLCEMAAYLKNNVTPSRRIETYEWSLDLLAPLSYRHPYPEEQVSRLRSLIFATGSPFPIPFWNEDSDFLVVGPFAKLIHGYPDHILKPCATLLKSIGDYQLYDVSNRQCFKSLNLEGVELEQPREDWWKHPQLHFRIMENLL